MRTLSAGLKAELASPSPRIARLLKLTLQDGTVHGYTDHELPLTVDSVVYTPAPGLQSSSYSATANVQVSNQKMGAGFVDVPEDELRGGRVDGAQIETSWVSWATPADGRLITFTGTLGEITWDETGFEADVVSFMKELERNIGWTYTSSCRHKLFGQVTPGNIGACLVNAASYTFTGSVGTVVTPKWKFNISGAAVGKGDKYFSNGVITFTSGNNSGLSSTVKIHSGEVFELFLPTAFLLNPGDTFSVQAGCDKTAATCKSKFNNIINHGGFPHINSNVQYR